VPQLAPQAKIGGPGGTRTCGQTVMSGRIKAAIVDLAAFSLEIDRVRCVLVRSFLERNWCGGCHEWLLGRCIVGKNRPSGGSNQWHFTCLQIGYVLLYPLRNLDEFLTLKNVDEV